MRRCIFWSGLVVYAACGTAEPRPATQVIVTITSDLEPQAELSVVAFSVREADGRRVAARAEYRIVAGKPKSDERRLPLTFSIVRQTQEAFLLTVTGYGRRDGEPLASRIVEQKAIVMFKTDSALLLRVFLGRACVLKACDESANEVCTPVASGKLEAGQCAPIATFGEDDLPIVDPAKLPNLASLPAGVRGSDAGSQPPQDGGTDAASDEPTTNTSGTGGGGGDNGGGAAIDGPTATEPLGLGDRAIATVGAAARNRWSKRAPPTTARPS